MEHYATKRLTLRPMESGDFSDFYALLTTPELCYQCGLPPRSPDTRIQQIFADFLNTKEMHRILCRDTKKPAGFLRISPGKLPAKLESAVSGLRGVTLSFMLYAPFRRQGLMTELLTGLIPSLLQSEHYIHCAVYTFNTIAPAMLRQLGFRSLGSSAKENTRYIHYLRTADASPNAPHYADFPYCGRFAATACMLHQHGVDVTAAGLARTMHLPALFVQEHGRYLLGAMLDTPAWLNLALVPHGFQMQSILLPPEDIPRFLRQVRTALLELPNPTGHRDSMVYQGQAGQRLLFENPCRGVLPHLRLTPRRLWDLLPKEPVPVLYLTPCEADQPPLTQHILRSFHTVLQYIEELDQFWDKTLSREMLFPRLHSCIYPIAMHFEPMVLMTGDRQLSKIAEAILPRLRTELYVSAPYTRLSHLVPKFAFNRMMLCYLEYLMDILAENNLPDSEMDQLSALLRFPIDAEPSGFMLIKHRQPGKT